MSLPQLSPTFDRSTGIGASEVGAALGLSRFVSPYALWARKTGRLDDQEQTAAMEWGLRLQDPILAAYNDRHPTERARRNSATRMYKAWPHLFATPDGWVTARHGRPGVVDAKAPRSADGWGADGSTEVPPDYYAQAQVQCLVYDAPWCDLAVLFHGSDFREYRILANRADQRLILEALQAWWDTYIVADQAPPIEAPALGSTDAALAAQFQGGAGELLATAETETLAGHLIQSWHNKRQVSEAYDLIRQQMEAILGDHDRLATGAGVITWTRAKDAQVTNWDRVAAAYRVIIGAMQASTGFNLNDPDVDLGAVLGGLPGFPVGLPELLDGLQSIHTTTKPGSRRFLVKPSTEES